MYVTCIICLTSLIAINQSFKVLLGSSNTISKGNAKTLPGDFSHH